MSMSTRISDLPGPSIHEPVLQPQQMVAPEMPNLPNEVLSELSNIKIRQNNEDIYTQNVPSNIHMNIKKKVHFKEDEEYEEDSPDVLSFVKSQITEENLLLLILLIVSTRTEFDHYISIISPTYFMEGGILLTVFKSVVILVFYLFMRGYILPKIKI